MAKNWDFVHNQASKAEWKPGLRQVFDYRDLGIKDATKGDFIAHIVRANGKEDEDKVQSWHLHDCTFQFVYVLNGWAEFEYAGEGVHRIEKGDCILQTPKLKHRELVCSNDFEVLEIVSPADFATRQAEVTDTATEAAD